MRRHHAVSARKSVGAEPVTYNDNNVPTIGASIEQLYGLLMPETNHSIFRSTGMRVVAGSMLIACACCALTAFAHFSTSLQTLTLSANNSAAITISATDSTRQTNCKLLANALGFGICYVAYYHYTQIIAVRRAHSDETEPNKLENHADAVRYSDWLVTLPALGLKVSLIVHQEQHATVQKDGWMWPLLLAVTVLCGAIARFAFGGFEKFLRLTALGQATFCLIYATAWFTLVYMLFIGPDSFRAQNEIEERVPGIFVYTWIAYGVLNLGEILVCLIAPDFYSNHKFPTISTLKDILYGALDVWSKAMFGIWACAASLDLV